MDNFKIESIHRDTIVKFKECFDENDSPKEMDVIEWQFLSTPVNKRFVNIAIDNENDKVAAIYATFPVSFLVNGVQQIATQSLDTITDKAYRGKGLFIKLAKNVYNEAISDGIGFVYGFPNGNSVGGFSSKLGWSILDPVPFLIKPLKTKYFLKSIPLLRYLPSLSLSMGKIIRDNEFKVVNRQEIPQQVTALWNQFAEKITLAVNRTQSYLHWRYISKPKGGYEILHCYDKKNNLEGILIYTIKRKHGGTVGYIMELIYNLNKPNAGTLLLQTATSEIRSAGADCILSWCFEHAPNYPIFKKEFFIKMPEKIRPIELHFGVRSFKPELDNILTERSNWFVSYSDSDTV